MGALAEVKLGDIYDVHNGLSKGGNFFGSGYPFLSFKTVFNNFFLPPVLPDLVQSTEKEQKVFDIKRGDVFLTRTSETAEELGMSSVSLKNYPQATFNGFSKRLRPKYKELVYPEFMAYYLRSRQFRSQFYGLASSMSTRASLSNDALMELKVYLPSMDNQKRIAAILKPLDDKIEINRRINENLEQQAQALFKSWFVDFEPFKNGEFVESELGMIPKGWRVGKLGELCEFKRGKGLLSKNAIPGDVPVVAGGLEPACYHNISNTKAPVITVSGSGANAGFMRMYHQEVWASDCSFIDITCENWLFVYCFLAINSHLLKHAQTGAVQPHVKPADIHDFDLAIPPKEYIQRFQDKISSFITKKGLIEQESRCLAELRDTLLPKLMSGKDIYFNIERLYHGTNVALFKMSKDERLQYLSDCVLVIRYLYPYYKPLIVDNTLSILYGDAMSQKVGWYLCGEIYDNLEIVEKRNLTSIDYDFNQIYLTNLYSLAYKYGHSFAGCELGEIAYSLIQGAEVIEFENYLSDDNIRNAIERIKDFVKNKEYNSVIVSFDKNDLDMSALELIEDGFKDDLLDFDTWQTSLVLNILDLDNFGYILKYSKPLDFNQYGIENGKEEMQEALKGLSVHSKKEEE